MTDGDLFENLVFTNAPNKVPLTIREGYSVVRLTIGKGAQAPPHVASHSAFFLVLKGKAKVTAGNREVELKENQYIAIDSDEIRGIGALEDLVILAIRD
jgi:quercetin dioxygenase-like cupin family protein